MAINIVAFVGTDNFDNIIYLSRILNKLGKKVLLVDHSDTNSLSYSIPQPQGINDDSDIITYRQVDFTSKTITEELSGEYDDILIAYGFREPKADITLCNRLIWVTDLYRFNYERQLSDLFFEAISNISGRFLLIKDAFEIKITPEIISERMSIRFKKENISVLYLEERDYINSLICHHNGTFRFKGISKQRSRYLYEEAGRLHPEIDDRLLKSAYRRAGKGE